jgi:glyoxylase-like metal-dependent hydrolase (beta-lactamase superfamily II)/ferredoxin
MGEPPADHQELEAMAQLQRRLSDNVPGDFYVDSSCIDCDTCRQVAPATFSESRAGEHSYVSRQPATPAERQRAAMALVACPTASIGTVSRTPVRDAAAAFPEPIASDVPDVFYCGYTSESSFGASSYLIRRPGGNVLVDSPRASSRLFARLEELGGVAALFLTHKDDVAAHRQIHERFNATRILHAEDVTRDTQGVERQLTGRDPIPLAPDLLAIPVPGHTRGSMALLYRDEYLFTGDHLWWSPNFERLHASRSVCWYSWAEQMRSIVALLDHRFTWVLPGHGRRHRAASSAAMHAEVEQLIAALQLRAG